MERAFWETDSASLAHPESANTPSALPADLQLSTIDRRPDNTHPNSSPAFLNHEVSVAQTEEYSAEMEAFFARASDSSEPFTLVGGVDYGNGLDFGIYGSMAQDMLNTDGGLIPDEPVFDLDCFTNSGTRTGDGANAIDWALTTEFPLFKKFPSELKITFLMLSVEKRPIIIENEEAKFSVKCRGGCPVVLFICHELRDLLQRVHIFNIQASKNIRYRCGVPDVVYFSPSVDELFFVNGHSGGAFIGGEKDIRYWEPFMELPFGLHNFGKLEEVVFGAAIWPWEMDKWGHTVDNPKDFKGPTGEMWFAPAKEKYPLWENPTILGGDI